ncbi:ATPase H(+)-transporting accessory protein 2 [Cylas formicarius]|uniref:ATPase H(+)-transporting accessory protein 2 n=1 Tax=Cylas formicarius TaxID=197179 RepID=UPI00295863C0|nr:ATPase H(+)-transporting accessory protein 2 [Cylas formicarius]
MFKIILLVISLVTLAYGAGEFSVLHHPPSLVFRGHDPIKQSTLAEVFSAALGFSAEHFSHWQGFYIDNPFDIPEAVVTVVVDGVRDIDQIKGHHFPLTTNEDESHIYNTLTRRIEERYPNENLNLVRIELENGLDDVRKYDAFRTIKSENPRHISYKHLKLDVEEDREFLRDVALLNEISLKVEAGAVKEDFIPDIYWFRLTSLHALSDLHGPNSTETKEAKQLLQEAINRLSDAFVKAYGNRVLANIITSDASHTRMRRNILATADDTSDKIKYNLASYYNKDFPVIFNIILWFSVVLFFAILAICLVTANMDPGRDSVIYRMTSTRMKKDN